MENNTQEEKQQKKEDENNALTTAELVSFATEIGYTVAVPLIILLVAGRVIDKNFGTAPLFLIIGLLLSIISTGIIIYKKVKKFTNF